LLLKAKPMEKEHWDRFTSIHSPKTCEYVQSIFGKAINLDEFVKAHLETCGAKKKKGRSLRAIQVNCGKDLFKFLVKFGYLNKDASLE
jgi:hypothetical protein